MIKVPAGLLLLISVCGLLIYLFVNWQKDEKSVAIVDLLSFANFYNEKKVCTRGYYVETEAYTILKASIAEDVFTRSIWIKNPTEKEIIIKVPGISDRYIDAKICGFFETTRAGEFGIPSVWNHQLTVEKFQTYGELMIYNPTFKF